MYTCTDSARVAQDRRSGRSFLIHVSSSGDLVHPSMATHTRGTSVGADSSHGRSTGSVHRVHADPCTSVDESRHWNTDETWQHLKRELAGFPHGLKVLELCGGMGTGHIALQELLGDVATFGIVGHFDIDETLRPVLVASGLPSRMIHLGKNDGDILKKSPKDIPLHHLMIAGPPCPPWSSLGARSSWTDARSQAFYKVMEIIAYQAAHGNLLLFIVENVVGMLYSTKACKERPIDTVVKQLRETCPGWSIEVHRLNSFDFGLPQSRSRLYIVGRKYCPENSELRMPPLQNFRRRLALGQCLEKSDNIPGKYTDVQKKNIVDWKSLYKLELATPKFLNQFAVVDASRTPTKRTTWGKTNKHPDKCQCLTASRGQLLHVLALGARIGRKRSLPLDRPMRNIERAKVQGFSGAVAQAAAHMSTADAHRILGNAMTVPVVGAVIGRELLGLRRALGTEKLTTLFSMEKDQARRHPHIGSHLTSSECSRSRNDLQQSDGDSDQRVNGIDGNVVKRRCLNDSTYPISCSLKMHDKGFYSMSGVRDLYGPG